MLNWRRIKNAALTATLVSSALGSATAWADAKDFKFPIMLCRFKQAVLRDSGGILKVVADREWGPEYAFPVGNVRRSARVADGDFAGIYEIPDSAYRLRLEGSVEETLDAASPHQLKLHTVLEKKLDQPDASGKLWQEVGHSSRTVVATTQADGSVWENVYPYTFNSAEMKGYLSRGKLKQDLVIAGIRDGLLDRGSVFKVGPACGLLDGRTAKTVASAENRQKFRAIFDHIADGPDATQIASQAAAAESKKPIKFELPQHSSQVAQQAIQQEEKDPRDQPEQQQPQAEQAQQAQQEMSPELQAQLAQQNQLADQAAAAYNFQQQQAQSGSVPVSADGRDPASSQIQGQVQGQVAQSLQSLQSPEQVQQHLSQLEQQRLALAQQQSALDQQQQFLMQKQQDLASAAEANAQAQPQEGSQPSGASQSSQAAPVGQGF